MTPLNQLVVNMVIVSAALVAGCTQKSATEHIAAAKAFVANSEPRSAVVELKAALQQDPKNAEARFLMASVALDAGDGRAALLDFRKAQELQFPADKLVPMMARAMLTEFQLKALIEQFGATKLSDPLATAELKAIIATAHLRQGQRAKAEAVVLEALRLAPKHPVIALVQARFKLGDGDGKAALALVEEAVARDPRLYDGWILLGDLRAFVDGDDKAALQAYRKAIALQGANLQGHIGAVSLLLQGRDVPALIEQLNVMRGLLPGHPQTKFFDAQLAYVRNDYAAARELVQQLLKVAPTSAQLLQLAGAIDLRLGSLLQAEAYLTKSLSVAPDVQQTRTLLARAYLRLWQAPRALNVLQPVLDSNAPGSEALALAGEALLQQGDLDRAESHFSQAAKLAPSDAMLRAARALAQIAKGKAELGFSELQAAAASDAGTTADKALIASRMKRKEFDPALQAIDALERKEPGKPLAEGLRGRVELERGNHDAARRHFEQALQRDKSFFPAVSSLALLDAKQQKSSEAKRRLEEYVAREPQRAEAWLALTGLVNQFGRGTAEATRVLERAATAVPQSMEVRVTLAEHYLAQENNTNALSVAQSALLSFPDQPAVLDVVGRAQFAVGDKHQALKTFAALATLQPGSPHAFMRQFDLHRASGDSSAAIASLQRALDVAPEHRPALAAITAMAIRTKQPEKALHAAAALKKRRPDDALAYIMEGDVRASQKDWEKAIASFRTATTKANPELASIRLHATLVQIKRTAEAEQFAKDWLQSHRGDARFLVHLGDVAMHTKDFAESERRYREVLKLSADHAPALNNLAWALLKQGKPGALEFAERAVSLAPDRAEFADTLAAAQAAAGQLDKAINTQRALVEKSPTMYRYRMTLARYLVRAGRGAQAREHLQVLEKLGDAFADGDEVKSMLKGIGN